MSSHETLLGLVLNPTAFCCNYGLEPGLELSAGLLNHSRRICGPHLFDLRLKRLQVGVGSHVDFLLDYRPPKVVQGVEIWTRWWPEVLGPRLGKVGLDKGLVPFCRVSRSSILLPDITSVRKIAFQPRQDFKRLRGCSTCWYCTSPLTWRKSGPSFCCQSIWCPKPWPVEGVSCSWCPARRICQGRSIWSERSHTSGPRTFSGVQLSSYLSFRWLWNWSTVKIFLSEKTLTVNALSFCFSQLRSFLACAKRFFFAMLVMKCCRQHTNDLRLRLFIVALIVPSEHMKCLAWARIDCVAWAAASLTKCSMKSFVLTVLMQPDPGFRSKSTLEVPAALASFFCLLILPMGEREAPVSCLISEYGSLMSRSASTRMRSSLLLGFSGGIATRFFAKIDENDASDTVLSSEMSHTSYDVTGGGILARKATGQFILATL